MQEAGALGNLLNCVIGIFGCIVDHLVTRATHELKHIPSWLASRQVSGCALASCLADELSAVPCH